MYFTDLVAFSLPVLGALAAPRPQVAATATSTASGTACSASPITTPTAAFGLISAHSASKVHLLPWNAAGFRFYLGGETASYCPETLVGDCPPGNVTAFAGTCGMDTEVPGGQQIYISPDGSIGYTQAHSGSTPEGAHRCPFNYEQYPNQLGEITLNSTIAFGATSFMGCPTDNGDYQVFAALTNATVPQGNVSDCIGFSALAADYTGGPAAWQYT